MRIVVDTNIVFSAILNTDNQLAKILLQPKSRLDFYSTDQLFSELEKHKRKIKKLSGYSDEELEKVIQLITKRIRFINIKLIPKEANVKAEILTKDVDIDDTEFVALDRAYKS